MDGVRQMKCVKGTIRTKVAEVGTLTTSPSPRRGGFLPGKVIKCHCCGRRSSTRGSCPCSARGWRTWTRRSSSSWRNWDLWGRRSASTRPPRATDGRRMNLCSRRHRGLQRSESIACLHLSQASVVALEIDLGLKTSLETTF